MTTIVATKALPGTEEKIEVLRSRFANKIPLWCQDDATFEGIVGPSKEKAFVRRKSEVPPIPLSEILAAAKER